MKNDPTSNMIIVDGLDAQSRSADTYFTDVIDHALAPSSLFHISCGIWASSFVATLQWSDASGSGFIDEADTTAGNDVSETLTEAGEANLDCPNPRGRYSRTKVVIGGTCEFSVANISGKKRTVDQG